MPKRLSFGGLLEVEMMKKCTPLWCEAHFEIKTHKAHHCWNIFGCWSVVLCGRRTGLCTLPKVSKTWRFCSSFKNDGRRGTFEEDLQSLHAYPGAGTVQATHESVRHVRWSGRWFPENGCMWSIRSWGLLRWFCVTDAALRMIWPHFFAAGAILWTNGMEKSQNALVRGRQLCTQLSADLLRFWCCQLHSKTEEVFKNSFVFSLLSSKIEKPRRIAAFLMLSSSKIEEVSQNSFVFTLAGKQIDR